MKALALLFCITCLAFAEAEWPQFRGPGGEGHSDATNLPTTWSQTENVIWRTQLPGRGWSSPVIAGNTIWLTTAYETEASEEERQKRLQANTGVTKLTVLSKLKINLLRVNRTTGAIEQEIPLLQLKDPQWVHQLNSYASPTPVLDGKRLYAQFGTYGTVAVDTETNTVAWRNTEHRCMHENGPGGSPVIHGDHLIFHLDGSDTQHVIALNKHSGELVWKMPRSGELRANPQFKKAYATPLLVGDTLVSPAADWVYGYDPSSGAERWKLPYEDLGFSNVARPVTGNGKVFICTCFMKSQLIAIDLKDGEAKEAWRYKKGVPKMPSPIVIGDEIYFVDDRIGMATCLDTRTGEERWRQRLGGNYSASPLHADGKLYFFEQNGKTTVLEPGPTFKKIAEAKLGERQMASPAAVDKALYIRTDKALYRIENESRIEK